MGEPKKRSRAAAHGEEGGEPPSFEGSLSRLEAIVTSLESADLTLEESLALFEEGIRLARTSQERLDQAERRVEELLEVDEHGNPVVRDLEPGEEE
jgi:exodeoxyribonuclease VII small subunit